MSNVYLRSVLAKVELMRRGYRLFKTISFILTEGVAKLRLMPGFVVEGHIYGRVLKILECDFGGNAHMSHDCALKSLPLVTVERETIKPVDSF